MTVKEQKERLIHQLELISDAPAFEANELIIFALKIDRSKVLYMQNETLTKGQINDIKKCLNKRKKYFPIQYILGEWEFYSLPFKVGRGVLIPRADSELLVDLAIDEIGHGDEKEVFDLCSGSGALGIAVAKECSNASVTLVEKSRKAFDYLKHNVSLNKVTVRAERADIFKWKPKKKADLIICNPPYIDIKEMTKLQKEVKNEPTVALYGGRDGLKFYRLLVLRCEELLNKGGRMIVEIGYRQAEKVSSLFEAAGFEQIEVYKDYGGNDRVVSGILK